ncbi:MAG: hypothetical protein MUF45_11140 [Spirosomaceae bacterium]|jgi:hypothetical protein|nr:hypothetical protein [Spirosomataceae bacterium]
MVSEIRKKYNESFTVEKYDAFIASIKSDYPEKLDFRVAETPVFVPKDLKIKVLQACNDIIDVLVKDDFKTKTEAAIPLNQKVPNENNHPSFLAIDFAVCRDENGVLNPQLIELQGFPSLFGYQNYIAKKYREFFEVPENYIHFFNRIDEKNYVTELKKLIVADENPENCILLEIFPEKQKTRIDFAITKDMIGIEAVCYTKIIKEGRQIFYEKDGRKIQIKRIYNRLIFDELEQYPDIETSFKMTDDVDIVWVAHPNWFFRISKYTLPLLNSPYVPKSHFLSDLKDFPTDLENYVLKPLYSFAGSGVKINVTNADLAEITDKENYLLQRKVKYEPVIEDPEGKLIKCELRMLYIWHEDSPRPKLLTNLARLSRGEMIGVNFNKNFDWVGGTVGFYEM